MTPPNPRVMGILTDAVTRSLTCRCVFTNWRGVTEERRFRVRSLVYEPTDYREEPHWYAAGTCLDRLSMRYFEVDKIDPDTLVAEDVAR